MIVVTHADPCHPRIGRTVEMFEWRQGEGVEIDFGEVYIDDPLDAWYWMLVQYNGTYYVGLPGLENYHAITHDQALDRALLDAEIGECLTSHGL